MFSQRTSERCPRCGKPKRNGYRKHNGLWLPDDPLRRPLSSHGLAGRPPLGYFQPVGDDCCACEEEKEPCVFCKDGTRPLELLIHLEGTWSEDNCFGNCSSFLGDSVLSSWLSIPACWWRYNTGINCNIALNPVFLFARLRRAPAGGDYILDIMIGGYGSGYGYIRWRKNFGSHKPNCWNWADLDIPANYNFPGHSPYSPCGSVFDITCAVTSGTK